MQPEWQIANVALDDFVSLPTRLLDRNSFARMGFTWIIILAHEWIRIFVLLEIAESVITIGSVSRPLQDMMD